jgi:transposase
MSKPYSPDLRVVAFVKAGASRHEAAERFEVSVSSASGGCNAVFGSGARPSSQSGKHIAVGGVCRLVARTGRQAFGFDLG